MTKLILQDRLPKGRGALSNPVNRFDSLTAHVAHDGWDTSPGLASVPTCLHKDTSKTILAKNDSEDIPYAQSINPYRGCEHGCIYCYARPSHAYLGFSAGIDFETQIVYKPTAAELLIRELSRPSYRCQQLVLGSNTDPYQPVERELKITRELIQVLLSHQHPVSIITKSDLVLRDIDLLQQLATSQLVRVCISVTTLDKELSQQMEPRAVTPKRRIRTIELLSQAQIPVTVMAAPMIPGLNDHELEHILQMSREAGAIHANYTMIRLPYELKQLFSTWLSQHRSDRAHKILQLIRECHGGTLYDPSPFHRRRGQGVYAQLLADRFEKALVRFGYQSVFSKLRTDLFRIPPTTSGQLSLW